MNNERINDLVDILGDKFAQAENTFVIKNNLQLARFLDNPLKWKEQQSKAKGSYKQDLVNMAKKQISDINNSTEKAVLISYKEVAKDSIEITQKEIIASEIPDSVKKQIKSLKNENINKIIDLANLSFKQHIKNVNIAGTLSTPDNLYSTIKNQMKEGIENGIKVAYKDGSNRTWKSYMEMNVRTTIQTEISNEQTKIGAKIGIIFYMCDSYGDCAKDHAEYQGKLYYNEDADISDEIMGWINDNGVQSLQSVRDGEPFLTTRPNCRHNFHAISTEEAMGQSASDILKKEGLEKGKFKESNYELSQKQRQNERTIRDYKLKVENANKMFQATKDAEWKAIADKNKSKVSEWQNSNRELIKSNPTLLKRDYDRENIKVITRDLGVRYDMRVENKNK